MASCDRGVFESVAARLFDAGRTTVLEAALRLFQRELKHVAPPSGLSPIRELSNEEVLQVCAFFGPSELLRFGAVSAHSRAAATEPTLWRELCRGASGISSTRLSPAAFEQLEARRPCFRRLFWQQRFLAPKWWTRRARNRGGGEATVDFRTPWGDHLPRADMPESLRQPSTSDDWLYLETIEMRAAYDLHSEAASRQLHSQHFTDFSDIDARLFPLEVRIDVDMEFPDRPLFWNGIAIKYRLVVQRKGVVLPLFETAIDNGGDFTSITYAPRTELRCYLEAETYGEEWDNPDRDDGFKGAAFEAFVLSYRSPNARGEDEYVDANLGARGFDDFHLESLGGALEACGFWPLPPQPQYNHHHLV